MYTISKNYGIGEITSEDEKRVTIYYADEDLEKTALKSFLKVYSTFEEADAALTESLDEEIEKVKETQRVLDGPDHAAYLSELNKFNARKNLPSSLR